MSEINPEYNGRISPKDKLGMSLVGIGAGGALYSIFATAKKLDIKLTGESISQDIAKLHRDSAIVATMPQSPEATKILERRNILNKGDFKTEIQDRQDNLKVLAQKSVVGELGVLAPLAAVIFGAKAASIFYLFRDNFKRSKSNFENKPSLDI